MGMVSSQAGHSALPPLFLIGDNSEMDAPTAPLGRSARLRHWFARHLVAMFATAIVLTCWDGRTINANMRLDSSSSTHIMWGLWMAANLRGPSR